ncbi:MAG TPA: hypothetical protein VL485_00005, partial [Ktedonobacteraceae bacterium]|nr:hypothetical protein [Ktedonobacteraceae bacterium]
MPGTHIPASLPPLETLPGGTALCAIDSNTLPPSRAAICVDLLLFSGNVLESMGLSAPELGGDTPPPLHMSLGADKPRLFYGSGFQLEWWVAIGDEKKRVAGDAILPAHDTLDEGEETARVMAGE